MDIHKVEEQKKKLKDQQDRLLKCAYEALEVNEYGKELSTWLRKQLYFQVGADQNHTYCAGYNDAFRFILSLVEEVKLENQKGTL